MSTQAMTYQIAKYFKTQPVQKAEFELSYSIAKRLDAAMMSSGTSRQTLVKKMGWRDREVARWLTDRYDFTTSTIAQIETVMNTKIIQIAKTIYF